MEDTKYRWAAGRIEMAHMLHVEPETFRSWSLRTNTTGCPTPVKKLAMGQMWDAEAVIRWYVTWKPVKGPNPGKLGYVDSEILEELGISNGQQEN